MIVYGPVGNAAGPPVASVVAEHSRMSSSYEFSDPPTSASGISLPEIEGAQAELQPPVQEAIETFDWSSPKLNREFVRLEQRALAEVASPEEQRRYAAM